MVPYSIQRTLLFCGCVLVAVGESPVANPLEVRDQTNAAMGFDAALWWQQYRPQQPDSDVCRNKLSSNDLPSNESRGTTDVSIPNASEACDNAAAFDVTAQERLMVMSVHGPSPAPDIDPSLLAVRRSAPVERNLAWDQARLAIRHDLFSEHTAGSDGPTMTTLLVGLVAMIVFTGAIFSEKE